jgi:hypothetical protein
MCRKYLRERWKTPCLVPEECGRLFRNTQRSFEALHEMLTCSAETLGMPKIMLGTNLLGPEMFPLENLITVCSVQLVDLKV